MPNSTHSFLIGCQDTLDQAREPGAQRMSVEVDGACQQYDVTMHIPEEGRAVILQPLARYEIVPDEKQIINPRRQTRTSQCLARMCRGPSSWLAKQLKTFPFG